MGQQGPAADSAGSPAPDVSATCIVVGARVICLSPLDRAKYDQKEAEVTVVNKISVWVRILRGPGIGEEIKRTLKQIKVKEDPAVPQCVVLAAGLGLGAAAGQTRGPLTNAARASSAPWIFSRGLSERRTRRRG